MSKIIGNNLPDMPWQEKPAGEHMPVWRYDQNPITVSYTHLTLPTISRV